MRRRDFMLFSGAAVVLPLTARAQQDTQVIGWVNAVSAAEWVDNVAEFRRGLGEAGFVEGRNVTIEFRWAEGHLDRMPAMAADLVSRKVAVLVVGGNILGVRAAMGATQSIPIVFTTGADPVAAGVVASINRPGGNVTGFTLLTNELAPKRLEILHEAIPAARRIALLINPSNRLIAQDDLRGVNAAAYGLGLEIVVLNGASENDIELAFAAAIEQRAAALVLGSDAFFNNRREQIAALSLRHALLPTMSYSRDSVAAGQLAGYGPSIQNLYRRAGVYVGRILKGEKPGDLPVQQPTKFDLIINLKTAKALGLTLPPSLLARADEVIE